MSTTERNQAAKGITSTATELKVLSALSGVGETMEQVRHTSNTTQKEALAALSHLIKAGFATEINNVVNPQVRAFSITHEGACFLEARREASEQLHRAELAPAATA